MSGPSQGSIGETTAGGTVPPELEGKTLLAPEEASQAAPEEALAKRPGDQPETAPPGLGAFEERTHSYLWENVVLADQKAAFLFAGLAATLAYLHEKGISRRWLADPRAWGLENWLAFLAVVGLLGGAALALLVVLPRFSGATRGVVYWKAIAGFESGSRYARHVRSLSQSDLHEAILSHSFELAQIAKRKFRVFHLALWTGAVGLVSALLHLALFSSPAP
jgi:hypothetical protein